MTRMCETYSPMCRDHIGLSPCMVLHLHSPRPIPPPWELVRNASPWCAPTCWEILPSFWPSDYRADKRLVSEDDLRDASQSHHPPSAANTPQLTLIHANPNHLVHHRRRASNYAAIPSLRTAWRAPGEFLRARPDRQSPRRRPYRQTAPN